MGLALALFMTGILADNAHHIIAADDLAGFAKAFDGGSDFHLKNYDDATEGISVVSLLLSGLKDSVVAG